jgi:thioredoxin-dependent peroxiredoxin
MSKKSRGKSALTRAKARPVKSTTAAKRKPAPKTTRPKPAAASAATTQPTARPKGSVKAATKAGAGKVELIEGQLAPAFNLPRDGGGHVALSDFAGRKLVLFFYPRANTPGCTKEAMDFSRLAPAFKASGTTVLGLSADSIKSQNSFRDKQKLTIPLLSDEKREALEAYGVWGEKSLYGRIFLGVLRTTVLIGADGRIARIWRNVKVDGHADAVLAAAKAL